ncbi:DUF1990 family protein [Leucobacter sp. CSA1]|uniref:DUF1990 family protein n=2 Tax=Leucobacter chromiisoli TaxID=2796471 RepID=A0A934Q7P8_9MICO|nr:DUF1990 family protein [Leucobacter chromiisoli]
MPASYAAVGASKAPDLLRFPPEGMTPFEETLRLGSGQERFITASSLLMTWGAQRGAGYEVSEIVRGEGERYAGVVFDADGRPEPAPEAEDQFGPDGEPYLTAGTTAKLRHEKEREPRAVMVVYTVDEPRRVGFAWGTSDEEGVVGEELLTVEHREDDTVWAVARGFLTVPNGGLLGIKGRSLLKTAIASVKDQLRSLAPGAGPGESPQGAETHDEHLAETRDEHLAEARDAHLAEIRDAQDVEDPGTDVRGVDDRDAGADVHDADAHGADERDR